MERYRNFVRLEQMKEHIRAGRNEEALKLAELLEPAKIKSNSDLTILSDLYLESGMLAKAGECLSELYSRKKTRSILMQLINLSVRIKKVEEAETYFREFKAMAPDDFYNYIFRYSIDKIKGRNYETLIESLEKLKHAEYIDSWAYELAKLYHKAGRKDDCIRECDDIVTWFGDGEFVDRAKALKAYYLGELNGMMSRPAEETASQNTESGGASDADDDRRKNAYRSEERDARRQAQEEPGIVEIVGTAENTAAGQDAGDDDMKVVPEADTAADTEDGTEDNADERTYRQQASANAAETEEGAEDNDLSDYEEDLKEFEAEFNIKLADEVMAQIEGYDENRFEVEPVDISGVLGDEEFVEGSGKEPDSGYGRSGSEYSRTDSGYGRKDPEHSRAGAVYEPQEAASEAGKSAGSEVIEEEYTAEDLDDVQEATRGEELQKVENGREDNEIEEPVREDAGEDNIGSDAEISAIVGTEPETAKRYGASAGSENEGERGKISGSEDEDETEDASTGVRQETEAGYVKASRAFAAADKASNGNRPVTGAELEAALEAELEEALAAKAEEEQSIADNTEAAGENDNEPAETVPDHATADTAAMNDAAEKPVTMDDAAGGTEDINGGAAGSSENGEAGEETAAELLNEPGNEPVPEPEEETVYETVTHDFKGLRSVRVSEDSLLAAFLKNNDAELEDYFGFFAYQADIRGQLIKTLEILLNPQIRNKCMVVSGGRNSGSKAIIKGITKILKESGFLMNPQIAFTEAEKINTMSLRNNVDRLIGCCLMINHAGRLSSDSVRQLLDANSKFTGKTAVIMSDHRSEISKLLKENRELNSMFPLRIHIPEYDAEDMEDLLFLRLNEKGYSIEKKAYDVMQKELRRIVREVGEGSLAEADRYIETVIDRLETRNARKLLTGGFSGVGEKDRIVCREDVSVHGKT